MNKYHVDLTFPRAYRLPVERFVIESETKAGAQILAERIARDEGLPAAKKVDVLPYREDADHD